MTLKELRALKFGERARCLQHDVAFILAATPPIVLNRWIKEVR